MTHSRPPAWIGAMLRLKPARIPWGHSIRSGLAVGLPFVVGAATGQVLQGMWVGLATLLLAAGEREGSHRLNIKILLISSPIAASAYLLGYLQNWPLWGIVPLMVVLGWLAGAIAGWGPAFSVGGMQFLLVAAIAFGVTNYATWWQPILWYGVGAAGYLLLMLVEFALDRRRPERVALGRVIDVLTDLIDARLTDEEVAHGDTARDRVVTALSAARQLLDTAGSTRTQHWADFAAALDAADSLQAMVLAEESTTALTEARQELDALRRGLPPRALGSGLVVERAQSFARAVGNLRIGLGSAGEPRLRAGVSTGDAKRPWRERLSVGPEVRGAASRLALCCGIAYGAKAYLPIEHWFWVPLTIALVMKPDFGSVFGRAVLRVIGTVVGAALAAGVIWLVHPLIGIAICIGVFAFFVPWFMMRSYALQAVAIAPAVILLVYSLHPDPGEDLPGQRILATAVGGVVVIVFGYLIWPHARRIDLARAMRGAAGSLADFAARATTPIPDDASQRDRRHRSLVDARRRTYAALSDLRSQLQRGLTEPPPRYDQAVAWIPAVAAMERLTDAVSDYSVRRLEGHPVPDMTAMAGRIQTLPAVAAPDDLTRRAADLAGFMSG